jgi:hypothetical protein
VVHHRRRATTRDEKNLFLRGRKRLSASEGGDTSMARDLVAVSGRSTTAIATTATTTVATTGRLVVLETGHVEDAEG